MCSQKNICGDVEISMFCGTSWFQMKAQHSTFGQSNHEYTENHNTKHIHETASTKGTHQSGFGVRGVIGEIWVLFVLLGEALLHSDLIGL